MSNENNKLIAEFIGRHGKHRKDLWFFKDPHSNRVWHKIEWMKFHSSWDWLMVIVEKIEQLNYMMIIEYNSCYIKLRKLTAKPFIKVYEGKSKINNVYNAVIEFIKWYNENK